MRRVTIFMMTNLFSIIITAFSRWREFRPDAGGGRLGGRGEMIAALEKLCPRQQPGQLPEAVEAVGIRGGLGMGSKRLFICHPPLEELIAAMAQG